MDGNLAALTISAEDSAVAFEPDESIGAAVLAHVHDVRDRLALACVSREWRRVAATEGSWGVAHDELVMKGELAKRLTDERLERLMRYYGRLKRVELRGFPPTFTGTFMTETFHLPPPAPVRVIGKSGSQKRDQLVGHRARQGVLLEPRRARSTQDGTPRSPAPRRMRRDGGGRPFSARVRATRPRSKQAVGEGCPRPLGVRKRFVRRAGRRRENRLQQ